jgi:hypothetical protein
MLGAPHVVGGKVSVFDPKLPKGWRIVGKGDTAELIIPAKDLRTLQKGNPGIDFPKKILDRYETAQTNFVDWNTPGSKMRTLVEGAARHPDGITILESRSGNLVPHGIKYLEQLEEPQFVQGLERKLRQQGLDPGEVKASRSSATSTSRCSGR